MKNEQNLSKGIKWTSVSSLFSSFAGILKISILTRLLDPKDFGLMAIITFVLGFTNLFANLGLSSAIIHKSEISNIQRSSLYWTSILVSVAIFLTLNSFSPFIAQFYSEPELTYLIFYSSFSILFHAIGSQFKIYAQKELNFRYIAIIEIISIIAGLIYSIVLAYNGYGIYALIYGSLMQAFISNLSFLFFGFRKRKISLSINLPEIKPFFEIGIYQLGSQGLNYFNRDIDLILIGKFYGPEILGGYSLAKQLVMRPMQIINPIITRVASPILALKKDNFIELRKEFSKIVKMLSTINFIAYSLLFCFSKFIIELLYGIEYSHINSIVQILVIYMYIRSVSSLTGSLVIATGNTRNEFYWNLIVLFITPLAILISAKNRIEIVSLTLMLISFLLIYPSWYVLIRKQCGLKFLDYLSALIPSFKSLKAR